MPRAHGGLMDGAAVACIEHGPDRRTLPCLDGASIAVDRAALCRRLLLNIDAILERLRYRGLTNVVITTITDRNSTAEQSCLFAKAGIVISVHSSQLVNMVFALPGSAVVRLVSRSRTRNAERECW